MADGINVTQGSGKTVATDEVSDGTLGTVQVQYVKLMDGTVDGTTKAAVGASGLKVDGSGVTQPVSGTVTANIGTSGNLALDTTLTGGTQKTLITDGTQIANTLAGDSGQNALLTAGTRKEVSFSTSSVQAVASTDVSNYRWVSVHIVAQGTSSTITYQGSNDNSNWVSVALQNAAGTGVTPPTSNDTTAGLIRQGPLSYRYFRLNVTGISGGTTSGVVEFFSTPPAAITVGAYAGQNGTWTVGSNSATGSAVPANAFYLGLSDGTNLVGARLINPSADALSSVSGLIGSTTFGLAYNGTNWDRLRSGAQANVSAATGYLASLGIGQYNATPQTITDTRYNNLQIDVNSNLKSTLGTALGYTIDSITNYAAGHSFTNITTGTTTTVKSGAGVLKKLWVNTTAAGTITVYDNTAGSGTKIGTLKASVAEGGYLEDIAFSTGLTIVTGAASDVTVVWR